MGTFVLGALAGGIAVAIGFGAYLTWLAYDLWTHT